MSFIYDRLYSKIKFPKIITSLLDCPGLLRLREISMANIPFFNFPSFTAVTRYEHSLGVCHLANIASKSLKLDNKDSLELMIAGLYHDITTPPFAHLFESILEKKWNFDHESYFYDLITASSKDLGKEFTQIYMGRALKLNYFVQSSTARKMGIDAIRIAELVLGKKEDYLSSLISGDIDLDNIDNVIRASSAMGIIGGSGKLAERLATAFVIDSKKQVNFSESSRESIEKWMELREKLYEMILCSVSDFSLQTMLKNCLDELFQSNDENYKLTELDWRLTEREVFEKIRKYEKTYPIYKRMALKDLYNCLNLVLLKGPKLIEIIEKVQKDLEEICTEIFHVDTIMNYYVDKRIRTLKRLFVHFNKVVEKDYETSKNDETMLLGFFTPERKNYFIKNNKKVFFSKIQQNDFLSRIRKILPNSISIYRIEIIQKNYPKLKIIEEVI